MEDVWFSDVMTGSEATVAKDIMFSYINPAQGDMLQEKMDANTMVCYLPTSKMHCSGMENVCVHDER